MTIFKSAKVTELEARVAELEVENATLATQRDEAISANEGVTADAARLAELETANAEIPALNQTIKDQAATITANAAQIVTLTEAANITPEKISNRAAELLAANGHGQPLKIEGNAGENVSHIERFNALSGAEATAYFKEHEKDIADEQKAARFSRKN